MLDHARWDPRCERLCGCVEVAQHCVSAPPAHKADHICVDARHEEGRGAASTYRARSDIVCCEAHLGSDDRSRDAEC